MVQVGEQAAVEIFDRALAQVLGGEATEKRIRELQQRLPVAGIAAALNQGGEFLQQAVFIRFPGHDLRVHLRPLRGRILFVIVAG